MLIEDRKGNEKGKALERIQDALKGTKFVIALTLKREWDRNAHGEDKERKDQIHPCQSR